MMFACPGGCGKRHPLAAGQLVIEYQPHWKPDGPGNWHNRAEPLVVILCAACLAKIVRSRAKVRT